MVIRLIITQNTTTIIVKCIVNTEFKLLLCQSIRQGCIYYSAETCLKRHALNAGRILIRSEVVEMLCLKGQVALALGPCTYYQRELGHPFTLREHVKKKKNKWKA